MNKIVSLVDDFYIMFVRKALKAMRRALARPEPDYGTACKRVAAAISTLQMLYALLNDLRNVYDEERAQGQGPREARPTSPAEDDPA